jgi:hypothetical protein
MAKQQNLEIRISKVVTGMNRINAMKSEIKTIIQFLLPYLSDHAQTEVNRGIDFPFAPTYDEDWRELKSILSVEGTEPGGSLEFKIAKGTRTHSLVEFRLFYIDPYLGESLILCEGKRIGESAKTSASIKPESLAATYVVECYSLVELLLQKMAGMFHPEDLSNEIQVFLAAAELPS